MEIITHFQEIATAFDAFILDLWGVIHDGRNPYPGAQDCLEHLRGAGKKIVLLSNAPRRAAMAEEGLRRMGVAADIYDALITSGETAYNCLAFPPPTSPASGGRDGKNLTSPSRLREGSGEGIFRPAGNSYIYIGLEKDRRILEGLPYQQTDDPQKAHFLILSHSFYDNQPMAELEPLLKRCLAAKLPALCVNPDMEVVRMSGEHVYCAGRLAADYAAKGGQVTYFGKPYPIAYDAAFKALGASKKRILAVGDSLLTDILGADRAGIKSALVTGGILKKEVGAPGMEGYRERCEALCVQAGARPEYVLGAFNW